MDKEGVREKVALCGTTVEVRLRSEKGWKKKYMKKGASTTLMSHQDG